MPAGRLRCEQCEDKLLAHPDPTVRAWLAAEPGQDVEILEVLASDMDPKVAHAARAALDARPTTTDEES